jgi:hypothetical protein
MDTLDLTINIIGLGMISTCGNSWFNLFNDVIGYIFSYLSDDDILLIQDLSHGMNKL